MCSCAFKAKTAWSIARPIIRRKDGRDDWDACRPCVSSAISGAGSSGLTQRSGLAGPYYAFNQRNKGWRRGTARVWKAKAFTRVRASARKSSQLRWETATPRYLRCTDQRMLGWKQVKLLRKRVDQVLKKQHPAVVVPPRARQLSQVIRVLRVPAPPQLQRPAEQTVVLPACQVVSRPLTVRNDKRRRLEHPLCEQKRWVRLVNLMKPLLGRLLGCAERLLDVSLAL